MKRGLSHIISGIVLIGIVFLVRGSIFTKNSESQGYIYEIIGILLIIVGIVKLLKII